MPAKKTSVYLIQRTLDLAGEGESLSGRLNQIVGLYDELIAAAMPKFSDKEWCAIFDANNGGFLPLYEEQSADSIYTGIWANIADSPSFKEKWGVDNRKLVDKLRELARAERIAVIEAIQTFWEHHQKPTDKAIAIATRKAAREDLNRPAGI
jgi:hypothetical protein